MVIIKSAGVLTQIRRYDQDDQLPFHNTLLVLDYPFCHPV